MAWFFSALKSLPRPSRRPPKRSRPFAIEDLEGRRLLSQAIDLPVTLSDYPSQVASGPGGNLWLGEDPGWFAANPLSHEIDRISPSGKLTSFPVPGNAFAFMLTAGSDGNVWFAGLNYASTSNESLNVFVGELTPVGAVTEFAVPDPSGGFTLPVGIVSGSGDDAWFGWNGQNASGQNQNYVDLVTNAGAITVFPLPSVGPQTVLNSLTVGADGNLRFTELSGNNSVLGRLSPAGAVTEFPINHAAYAKVGNGPHGTLIVTAANAKGQNVVDRVSTAGTITPYKLPAAIASAFYTYLGSADGSLWFSTLNGYAIGRINPKGVATAYSLTESIPRGTVANPIPKWTALSQNGDVDVLEIGVWLKSMVYRLAPSTLPRVR